MSPVIGSGGDSSTPFITYTEQFKNHFPYYLSIGMSYELYWDGPADLVKDFRKAHELKNEAKNQELWLQGMYFYEALARISPLLHAFAKQGTKAEPYLDKPYPITKEKAEKIKVDREAAKMNAQIAKFSAMASAINVKFKGQSEVKTDGDRNRSITD